jgi:hypothetical protein
MKYGWYSEKQARVAGTIIWRDSLGTKYLLSSVTNNKEHGMTWDDLHFIAVVTEFVERTSAGDRPLMSYAEFFPC